MNDYVNRLSLDHIDQGAGDEFARQLLSKWRQTEGALTDDYIAVFPKLVLFDGAPCRNDTPDLLVCGQDALPRKILGSGWTTSSTAARQFLGKSYCAKVGQSYYESTTTHQPIYDIVRATMKNMDGAKINVRYQRLILPIRTDGGSHFLMSYSFSSQTKLLERGFSVEDRSQDDRMSKTPNYANLFQQGVLASQLRTGYTR